MNRLCLLLLLAAPIVALAQPRGVTDAARREITRRGKMEQLVSDDIQADESERFRVALAVPAVDSDKFTLTVLYGKERNAVLDRLKADMLAADPANLGAWLQVKDRGKGTYDVYSTEQSHLLVRWEQVPTPGNPERWKGIKTFPALVLSNPRSGILGKPGIAVDVKFGYDGKPESIATWLHDTIEAFCESADSEPTQEYLKSQHKFLGQYGGHGGNCPGGRCTPTSRPALLPAAVSPVAYEAATELQWGANYKPPFEVTQKVLPVSDSPVSPFPPNLAPVKPPAEPLTVDQIKQAVLPDVATSDFLLAQLAAKPTSADQVKMAWLLQKKPADQATHPVLNYLVGSGLLLLLAHMALSYFGAYAKSTPSPTDDLMADFAQKVLDFIEKKQATLSAGP